MRSFEQSARSKKASAHIERASPVKLEISPERFRRLAHLATASLHMEKEALHCAEEGRLDDLASNLRRASERSGASNRENDAADVDAFVDFVLERNFAIDKAEAAMRIDFGLDMDDPEYFEKLGKALFELHTSTLATGSIRYSREPLQPVLFIENRSDLGSLHSRAEIGHSIAGFYTPARPGIDAAMPIVAVDVGLSEDSLAGVIAHERQHAINDGVFGIESSVASARDGAYLRPMNELQDEVIATIRNLGIDKFLHGFTDGGLYKKLLEPPIVDPENKQKCSSLLFSIGAELRQFAYAIDADERTTNDDVAILAYMCARVKLEEIPAVIRSVLSYIEKTDRIPSEWPLRMDVLA